MDKAFLNKIQQIILKHLEDENLNVETLAFEIGLSRSQLLRKVKALTGKSVNQFIREIRLQEAAKLIQKDEFTASEIAYRVGFSSPSYFNKCFHEYFGLTPGDYGEQSEVETKKIIDKANSAELIFFKKPKVLFSVIVFLTALFITSFFINRDSLRKNKLQNSIAVLYFDDMSSGSDTQWFCDGVTDEIYTKLSKLKDLNVISRTSTKRFMNSDKTIPEITKELGVSYLIEGSVKKYSDMFRITVKLINSYDEPIWSEEYEEKIENISKIQREVSTKIVEQLHIVLSPEEEELINTLPTDNLKAYELYLKGRFYWHQRTKNDLEKSIYYYEQALELDSTYALAYAGLADVYFIMAWWRWYPKNEGYNKGKVFATKALSLSNNISEAHATLGGIACWQEWNWELAEKEIKLAISLNQNNATAHQYYSELLNILGRHEEARKEIDLALKFNPFSIIMHNLSSEYYYDTGDYEKALAEREKNRKIDKFFKTFSWRNFDIYILQKENLKAIKELKKIVERDSLTEKYSFNISKVYKEFGMEGVHRELIASELKMPDKNTLFNLAKYHAFLGDKEKALTYLEECYENRVRSIVSIKSTPYLKDLKSEPRFKAILKKMGLED